MSAGKTGANRFPTLTLQQAQAERWDVIVVGAGLGGGLLGRRLTESGLRVLFVERGLAGYPSERSSALKNINHPVARSLRGLWPKPTEARQDGVPVRFFGPYGSGLGGSSVFYAAALERPEPHDLDDSANLPHPTGGWPVGYAAFRPYLDQASELMHLAGTPDPLSREPAQGLQPPGPISEGDAALMEEMQARGLHPYRVHLALRYPQQCRGCLGSKCPWGCKMDGRSAGVIPALETGRAGLLDECAVREVHDDGTRVTGLRVIRDGTEATLAADTYVLCGGSFGSAQLLLASTGSNPAGCANSSGWVGRGLMFHLDEIFVLWPRRKRTGDVGFGKAIALRDLYSRGRDRFGLVQSLGIEVSYESIVNYLNRLFDQSLLRRWPRLRALTRLPAIVVSRLFGKAAVFVGMMEDFPYPENRVVLNEEDPDILTFEYTFHPELLARRKRFRKALLRAFRGHRRFMVSLQPVLNYGHPLGTLRFGEDPETSVLRPDCRTHDLENLYVADASFMPSAMGVNPSLTIAANALRVADIISASRQADMAGNMADDVATQDQRHATFQ